jgi:iron complex transport system substrate-binding protein
MSGRRLLVALAIVLAAGCRAPRGAEEKRGGIISMVPAATEILFALDAGERVIGVSDFCRHPAGVEKLPHYGGILNPSIERIVTSGAEAIVLHKTAGKLATACRDSGMRVVQVGTENLADMDEAIAEIGALTGRDEQADEMKRRIHAGIDALGARTPEGPRPRVVIIVDRAPDDLKRIFVAGPGSLLHELLIKAGGVNVFEDAKRPYPMVSLETIVTREPDVIVDMRPLSRTPDAGASLGLWKASGIIAPDGPVGRIEVVETDEFTVFGPRSVSAATKLFDLIHDTEGHP